MDQTSKRLKLIYIDCSSSNPPTSFSSAATSLKATGLAGLGYKHMKVVNETGSRIAITLTDADAATPSSSTTTNDSQDIISATTTEFKDFIHVYDKLYIRSDSGSAITSGIIAIEFWG